MSVYYTYFPPVAAFVDAHGSLKIVVRCLLTLVVYSVQYPYGLGLIPLSACFSGSEGERGDESPFRDNFREAM